MELRKLRYFLAVADEESISRAAKTLFITQPTLSRQLMQLEEELGEKLLTRGGRRISLTEEGMRGFANAGEGAEKTVHSRLVYNCFGDYYTRPAIDLRVRELITACILATLGDVRPQLISHLKANIAMGNTREYLKQIVLLLQPYNGYPRTLNALSAIDEA